MQTKCAQNADSNRRNPGWRRAGVGLAAVMLWQIAAYSQPQTVLWVNCGGEGERPCGQSEANRGWGLLPANTPSDNSDNSNDTLRCDGGLQIHFDNSRGRICANKDRLTVGETDPAYNSPWLSFARLNQYDGIQADQPITFAPILGTHNSYSNYVDGAESQFSTDQGVSITDQLQFGARLIRLDPWPFSNTDYQIKLCHSSNLSGIDGRTLCDIEDPLFKHLSLNRSFIFAIKEIAHWLRQHPSEFVVIRLHDTTQHWGDTDVSTLNGLVSNPDGGTGAFPEQISPTSYSGAYYIEAVAHELGNMVYKNPGFSGSAPPDYRFPSLRQLRAMGKQVLILSAFPSDWAFEGSDGNGLLTVQASPDTFNPALCTPGFPGSVTSQHSPLTFAETGEDRTLSSPYQNKMVDVHVLKNALACGFNEIGLDFLGTLAQAPNPHALFTSVSPLLGFLVGFSLALPDVNFQCDDFSQGNNCSTVDTRRETMIWSWQPNQGAGGQPARMSTGFGDPFGSWVSVAHDSMAPYLCAGPASGSGFPDGSFPDDKAWYVTQTIGAWENGEDVCQTEKGTDWHFWHPASALQNIRAWGAIKNSGTAAAAWTNHYNGPVLALPGALSFTTPQGVVPSPRAIVVTGGLGGQLTVTSSDPSVSVNPVQLYATWNAAQTTRKDNNDSSMYTIGLTPAGANLAPGNYTFPVKVQESSTVNLVNPGVSQSMLCCDPFNVTVHLTVTAPVTTVTSNPTGLVILVDGAPYVTPHNFSWSAGSSHTVDASQPTLNTNLVQAAFHRWSDGGAVSHQVTAANGSVTLTADFDASYFLFISAIGHGTVTVNGNGGAAYYPAGQDVSIQATPQSGSYFVGFSGDLTGTKTQQTLRMGGSRNVTATFADYAVVEVTGAPSGVSVTADGNSFAVPATYQWIPNSSHTLAFPATVPLGPGRQLAFQKWSDGNLSNPRTITAVNGAIYTPVFVTQDQVTTAVSPAGSGQITFGGWYTDGGQIQFNATANGGYTFTGFSGSIQATTSPQSVTLSGPLNVVANFAAAAPRINVTGTVIADSDPNVVQLGLGLNNSGLGAAAPLNVTVSASVIAGSGTVNVASAISPIASLQGGTSTSVPLTLNWPTTATRIRLTVSFTANGGAYQGSQILSVFR